MGVEKVQGSNRVETLEQPIWSWWKDDDDGRVESFGVCWHMKGPDHVNHTISYFQFFSLAFGFIGEKSIEIEEK